MYLKEISIAGFKSFADKIKIELDGKITAVVGPNGSGKSNIVDAVRWVLGEQSVKSLRGTDNMTDVIFAGSKSRNPLNVASVALTFDNTDHYLKIPYDEVSVKRRVYRTGESEYFLNGEKVRLKDVIDLLIDSASSKESFNIISQGEIGKILSNSPYERRLIFESAAGVLKYKKRKEEAIRKLDKTQDNMERVLDILTELEERLNPLAEQSKKAQEYLKSKERLESVEVALLAHEIESLNYQYTEQKKKIEEMESLILNLNLKNSTRDSALENDKVELLKMEQHLKESHARLLELATKEEKLNGEKELWKERSKYRANDAKVHNHIATLKEELYQAENNILLVAKDIEKLQSFVQEEMEKANQLEQEKTLLEQKRTSLFQETNTKKRELFDLSHQIDSLENDIESYGNSPSSVKAILNNPRIKGVDGSLASLIECDEAYLKALEVSLASVKHFLVVEDETVAKNAIRYLKENNLGRATFFPRTVIKAKGIEREMLEVAKSCDGYVGVFLDLVSYDEKYYGIVANQLGNVIVSKDLDSANRISEAIYRRYKVVSLEGDVVHVGGSISGGSVNLTRSLITEKKELEIAKRKKMELEEVLDSLLGQSRELDSSFENLESKVYNVKSSLISYQEQTKAKEELAKELQNHRMDLEKELSSLENVVSSNLSKEEEKIMKDYYEVSLEKENLAKEIAFEEKKKEELSMKIEEQNAETKMANTKMNQYEKELKELEINLGKCDMQLDQYLNVLSEEYSMTFEKAKSSYPLEMEPKEAKEEVQKYRTILKNIGMVNLESIEEYQTVSSRYQFLKDQQNDLNNAKETLLEIILEMDQVMKQEFQRTFDKVRKEFQKVFQELFQGGEADLRLTDPDNLLETGVDIVASPPGKKLKTITLLSGGEMTLTAISLIFAILNIRSVPFCIFDEVEAALDEANVDQFGRYLDHYKDSTQFLIITHKKKTMEYADHLYGVTMQEQGVSKLVSVKLADIEEEK